MDATLRIMKAANAEPEIEEVEIGEKVYLRGTDHWRCRFRTGEWRELDKNKIFELLKKIEAAGFDTIKTENLYTFDGETGFSEVHG